MSYPTAVVHLQIGSWQREARVVVAPGLLVPVLLGGDLYDQVEGGGPVQGFAVVTRSARRRAEQGLTLPLLPVRHSPLQT